MARKGRDTLKLFFQRGAMPSADHFGDFIDSTVNQVDDGFKKTAENGLEISSLGAFDTLISFFRESRSEQTLWSIGYDEERDKLLFRKLDDSEQAHTVLSLAPDGKVGINRKDPQHELDVDGFVSAKGRIGAASADLAVPADGEWHNITETLTGCHALEVIAGVGKPGTGRYALVHGIAMNAYNPAGLLFNLFKRKNRIRCQNAYYSSRRDRLQLRWEGREREYRLQLRSHCDYGEGCFARYYITRLWFDAEMVGSSPLPGGKDRSGVPDD
ncbi:MAG: hypothetical protein GY792_13135 [Gammaproteobacteria bacterium]|nr:hypothetical protein [Gammaproteobacteria bacterium]